MERTRRCGRWDALEDGAGEAADTRARSELMIALRTKIESWSVNQTKAARRLRGDPGPRLNDLMQAARQVQPRHPGRSGSAGRTLHPHRDRDAA